MKLILLRNQSSGFTGKISFSLTAKVDISKEEEESINKYKMGKVLLVSDAGVRGTGLIGAITNKMLFTELTVNELIQGKTFECKDILEMMDFEKEVIGASKLFKEILETASTFGGETIIEI